MSDPLSLAWVDELEIPWMRRPNRRAVVAAFADAIDTASTDAVAALRNRSVLTCSETLLPLYGDLIDAPRQSGETIANWRVRMARLYAARDGRGSVAWLDRLWRHRVLELPADGLRVGYSPIGPTARAWWSTAAGTAPPAARNMLLYAGSSPIDTVGGQSLSHAITSVVVHHTAGDRADHAAAEDLATTIATATEAWIETGAGGGNRLLLEVLARQSSGQVSTLQVRRSRRSAGYPTIPASEWWRVSWATRSVVAGRGPSLGIAGGTVADRAALITDRLAPYTSADIALHNGG